MGKQTNNYLETTRVITRIQYCSLILSFSSEIDPDKKQNIFNRAANSLAFFGDPEIGAVTVDETTTILSNYPREKIAHKDGSWLFLHGTGGLDSNGELLNANRLLSEYLDKGPTALDRFEPPFVAIAATDGGASAHSDFVGLGHLFSFQGSDCAVVSTSASAIARSFDRPLNHFGLFQQMTIGHLLDNTTLFEDVTMVPAGTSAHLKNGTVSFEQSHEHDAGSQYAGIADGAAAIRTSVERCITSMPDAAIELSGGLDSRIALSAIPEQLRAGRHAITIGYPDSPDIASAKKLAEVCGLSHEIIDLSQFNDESIEKVWERSRRVAYRDDFSTNAYDRLTIDCVDDFLLETSRIGGVNGEFARGFYYAAMPIEKPVTQESISRLLSWRLTTNDAAPDTLFKQEQRSAFQSQLGELVADLLSANDEPLGSALDRFYLNQRMRRWAGSAITRAMADRTIFTPFFHSDFVKWASGVSATSKRDSVALSKVLQDLDEHLSNIPLDSGLLPAAIANGGLAMKLAGFQQKARKLKTKLLQRFGGSRKLSLGGKNFQQKLSAKDSIDRLNWSAIGDIGFFDQKMIEQLRSSEINGSRTTIGYLLPLSFLTEYLREPDNKARVTRLAPGEN
ncbi:asparagine synthase-related protein [Roseibium album]|uniref:asparagine synthase-related protein n=1 Tax=Roseibium album TaxID=311410 RepID=UPI00329A74EE